MVKCPACLLARLIIVILLGVHPCPFIATPPFKSLESVRFFNVFERSLFC